MSSFNFKIDEKNKGDSSISTNEEWTWSIFQTKELFSLNNLIEPSTELLIDSVVNLSFGEDDNYINNSNQNYKMKREEEKECFLNKEDTNSKEKNETVNESVIPEIFIKNDFNSDLPINDLKVPECEGKSDKLNNEIHNAPEQIVDEIQNKLHKEEKVAEEKEGLESSNLHQDKEHLDKGEEDKPTLHLPSNATDMSQITEEIKNEPLFEENSEPKSRTIHLDKGNDSSSIQIDQNSLRTITELTEKLEKSEMKNNIMDDTNNKLLEVIKIFKQIQSMDTKNIPNAQDINECKGTNKSFKRSNSEGKFKVHAISPNDKAKLYIDYIQTNNKTYAEIHGKENQKTGDLSIPFVKPQCKCGFIENNKQNKETKPVFNGVLNQVAPDHKKPRVKRKQINPSIIQLNDSTRKAECSPLRGYDDNNVSWYNNTNSFNKIVSNRIPLVETVPKEYRTLGQDNIYLYNQPSNKSYQNSINHFDQANTENSLNDYFKQPVNEIRRFPTFQWNNDKMSIKSSMQEENKNRINNKDILNDPYWKIKPISLSSFPSRQNCSTNQPIPTSTKNKNKYVDYKRFQVIFEDDTTKTNTNCNHIYSNNNMPDTKSNEIRQTSKDAFNTLKTKTKNTFMQQQHLDIPSMIIPFYIMPKQELINNVMSSLNGKPKKKQKNTFKKQAGEPSFNI